MKRLIPLVLIVFSFFSCQKTEQPKSSVLDLFTNAYYGDMHSFSEWDNRFWEVFPNHGKVEISALTFNVSIAYFDSLSLYRYGMGLRFSHAPNLGLFNDQ